MLGILTLIAFAAALAGGGWWWAGFVFFLLAWLGKRGEAKAKQDAELATEDDPLVDWPRELVTACSSLTSHGYYVGDLTPEKKRAAATANYPLPGDGEILALIDATVFGSATKGLAIGEDGISWKNGSEKPVKLLWSFLARSEISSGDYKASVGELKFDNSGSSIKLEEVETLLLRLQAYALSVTSQAERFERDEVTVSVELPKPVASVQPIIAINSAEFSELLALPGIGAAEAQMIIKRRDEQAFGTVGELVDYLGLKPHFANRLDGLTNFEAASASSPQPEVLTQKVVSAPRVSTLGGRTID